MGFCAVNPWLGRKHLRRGRFSLEFGPEMKQGSKVYSDKRLKKTTRRTKDLEGTGGTRPEKGLVSFLTPQAGTSKGVHGGVEGYSEKLPTRTRSEGKGSAIFAEK